MKEEQIDGVSNSELMDLEEQLGNLVSTYRTMISIIYPNDMRSPPGDLHGTGSYFEVDGNIFLLTCEHVGKFITDAELCASFNGSEAAFSLPNTFSSLLYPADIAITAITKNTWESIPHSARTIPYAHFAEKHDPIDNELMYVSGYPGELSRVWPAMNPESVDDVDGAGIQYCTAISLICEINDVFDHVMNQDNPQPLEDMHFLLPYTPEFATYMNDERDNILPRAPGLSGSLVWNTRYREIKRAGGIWKPSDARVTGIIWGNSTKAGVLVATPVEYIRQLIELARKNMSEDKPYWHAPS
ncbi:hypothetical protein [Aeromonas media]|uniref:hypothetical protein n=1 Tax=Aeromonas media TaxID=651 RepID=UPI0029D9868C|nr:hypothetical protein [Aeromonas media]MDX7900127.1 hypothetical protein [Aeromonas media]